jgi:hypothetical protein
MNNERLQDGKFSSLNKRRQGWQRIAILHARIVYKGYTTITTMTTMTTLYQILEVTSMFTNRKPLDEQGQSSSGVTERTQNNYTISEVIRQPVDDGVLSVKFSDVRKAGDNRAGNATYEYIGG